MIRITGRLFTRVMARSEATKQSPGGNPALMRPGKTFPLPVGERARVRGAVYLLAAWLLLTWCASALAPAYAEKNVSTDNVKGQAGNTMSAPYYRFDGDNDYISFGDVPDANFDITDSFSISVMFFIPDISDSSGRIISKNESSAPYGGWYLKFNTDGSLTFMIGDNPDARDVISITSSTGTISEAKWHTAIITYDGSGLSSGLKIYIDGVLAQSSDSGAAAASAATSAKLSLASRNASDAFTEIAISGVKLFNTVLTAAEVKELYSGASVPFKYQGTSGTLLNTGTAANTGAFDHFRDASATGYTASNSISSGGKTVTIALTGGFPIQAGKRIGISMNHTTCTGVSAVLVKIQENNLGGNAYTVNLGGPSPGYYASGRYSAEGDIVATTNSSPYLRVWYPTTPSSSVVVSDIEVYRIGCLAEYDGSSATGGTWHDKSGNDLDGTVSGASLENK